MSKILVTGSKGGLGRFLMEELGAQGFSRDNDIDELVASANSSKPYDLIVHSAFNLGRDIKYSEYTDYLNDTLILTQKLASLPHKKFVFISSIDVYPKGLETLTEDTDFIIDEVEGLYGRTKLQAEMIVRQNSDNFVIARPSALLGKYARKNSLMKILQDDSPSLGLNEKSSFNYVLYEDILEFIQTAQQDDLQGVFNLCANGNLTLEQLVQRFGISGVNFGGFVYNAGNPSNDKVQEICPAFAKSSIENVEQFQSNFLSKSQSAA